MKKGPQHQKSQRKLTPPILLNRKSYADAAKVNLEDSNKSNSTQNETSSKLANVRKQNNVHHQVSNDVTSHYKLSQQEQKKTKKGKEDNNSAIQKNSDLPEVVFVHDSVMSKVNGNRLALSYGFQAEQKTAYKIDDMGPSIKTSVSSSGKQVDAIVIHCGLNDVKKSDPQKCSKAFAKEIKEISAENPNSQIVISKIAPIHDANLEVQRNVFNAMITKELYTTKNVSFIDHTNFNTKMTRDGIHPTTRGASILAGNLGRHIRNLFWKKPRRSARWRSSNNQNKWGFSDGPSFSPFQQDRQNWYNTYGPLDGWY